MSASELHEALRCFSLDVPLEQCADIIRDFMRDHKDSASGGLDHAQFVRFVLEIDNPDEFTHIGAGRCDSSCANKSSLILYSACSAVVFD